MVGAATHVLHTGLNVRLGVNQFGTGAPGFCMQHLFTGVLLNDSKHMHNYLMQTKKNIRSLSLNLAKVGNKTHKLFA